MHTVVDDSKHSAEVVQASSCSQLISTQVIMFFFVIYLLKLYK